MTFAPNTGYAFAVGTDTWHSADAVGPEVKTRDSILLTYFVDAGALRVLPQPRQAIRQFRAERSAQPAALRASVPGAARTKRCALNRDLAVGVRDALQAIRSSGRFAKPRPINTALSGALHGCRMVTRKRLRTILTALGLYALAALLDRLFRRQCL